MYVCHNSGTNMSEALVLYFHPTVWYTAIMIKCRRMLVAFNAQLRLTHTAQFSLENMGNFFGRPGNDGYKIFLDVT